MGTFIELTMKNILCIYSDWSTLRYFEEFAVGMENKEHALIVKLASLSIQDIIVSTNVGVNSGVCRENILIFMLQIVNLAVT